MTFREYLKRKDLLITLDLSEEEILTKMYRAGGDCICTVCQKRYYDHPYIDQVSDWEDNPYLHYICDGSVVKL